MSKTQEQVAQEIATKAHRGQVDKAGIDYINHPATVAASVATVEEKAVAWLHDVVEDTRTTLDDLRRAGLSEEVVCAVDAMTHREGEEYLTEYIPRIKANALARSVKLADLAHNMDISRLGSLTDKDKARLAKYAEAKRILEQ